MRGWKSLSFENFLVLMMFDGKELLEQQQMSNVLIFELIILIKFKEYSLMSSANVLITQINYCIQVLNMQFPASTI